MEDIDSSPAQTPNPRKRAAADENDGSPATIPLNLKGTQFVMPTPPDTDHSSNVSANNDDNSQRASPSPSSSALSSVDVVDVDAKESGSGTNTTLAGSATAAACSNSGPPPAKRRKLTPAEKQQRQQEKEAKAVEKAEQKAQKEEEKKAKDEEKRQKAEERDEKKRVKDEEKRKLAEEREAKKREREMEEERKAQEKLKMERSQMRLGAFFQKPATPVKQDETGGPKGGSARRKSLSLEPFDAVADEIRRSQSPTKSSFPPKAAQTLLQPSPLGVSKSAEPDYRKYFLPFHLRPNCTLAADDRPKVTDEDQNAFDMQLCDPSISEKYDLGLVESYASLERQFANERKAARGFAYTPVRTLVERIHGSLQQPIDLTKDRKPSNPREALQDVSLRYLEFAEDVRPAYFGTYSKAVSPRTSSKLRRNPHTRARKDTDYGYDSEAEWEEPEEGEDLLEDEDDEADSQGDADEMDEFLDDEEDALKNKRKQITGDLVPSSTGLCWEDSSGKIMPSLEGGSPGPSMKGMRMGYLVSGFSGATIDPFSTAYWQNEPAKDSKPMTSTQPVVERSNGFLAPPRPPLQPRLNGNGTLNHMLVGAAEGEKGPITNVASTQGSKSGRKPVPKTLSTEDMQEFKEAVVNSPLSKADLLKGLKAR
jgi:chromatin assembly factor 1 subunit A